MERAAVDGAETEVSTKRQVLLVATAGCILLTCAVVSVCHAFRSPSSHPPATYAELVSLSEPAFASLDVARMNVLCAEGLPGAEDLDVERCLGALDGWAERAMQAERKFRVQYDRNPVRYDSSIAKFKAVNLALTLKEELGCGYDMQLVKSGAMADLRSTPFFRDARPLFLHGFVDRRTGSCASLPVLMVAVGRRCGYPLFLVGCKGHLFCRWDDGRERFNIETAMRGVDIKPDAHYRTWPHPCTDREVEDEKYLKSLTPAEELGVFAQIRAACLQEHGRLNEAADAYRVALRAFPRSKQVKAHLREVEGG